ncbi:TetR/AcrR family transcriptional regulator [Chitinophaga sp. XS-30]|uniref:TetR/AcrR family transcriptional regulator n=1 Tax=Chitinophaga sp. XS-30 TaxID=2604421 RepID=UPI0011DCBEC7|nr:TetR/AcrR family transcriptional regulator [Chitinophaga sp. XS-30]QEH41990.1 TetR/AcrR family transcriptional regulator [Chitinophaga sp. XS-30]
MQPRERILDTALALFHKQGYNSTGINQIIAESNVAKASFYQHFKSKDELCAAFLNKRHDVWFARLGEFTAKSRTAKTKVLAAFDFLELMNETEDFRGCSFLNLLSEIPAEKTAILLIMQRHKNELREHFTLLLEDAPLADHVYLLFESAIVESQLFRSQWPVKKAKSIVHKLIR